VNNRSLLLLNTCIEYYNTFINSDTPITGDSTLEHILKALLSKVDVIALVIYRTEVTSLLFNEYSASGYVDDKIDHQPDFKYTPKYILLSISIEKEKQDLTC
jgi:hypothetical protein